MLVWAVPLSLAATSRITFVFSSSVYLDVSVQQVILLSDIMQCMTGCPIRISMDRLTCADPHSFSQLITSFIFVKSLGILHTPFRNLSILYYIITPICQCTLKVENIGVEPMTSCVQGRRSSQLS